MAGTTIERQLLERLRNLATASPVPLAEMSMDEIARAVGMTRMTLYRRAGTREQIVEALRQVGVDARRQPDVYERVTAATVDLLRERPIAELTLDVIAHRADCSLPAIHARFGGRQGVLKAMFERHSPLIPVESLIATRIQPGGSDLRSDIQLLYQMLFDLLRREWVVLRAFLVEVLRDPGSEVGMLFRDWYVPRLSSVLIPFLSGHMERGAIRPLPIPIVLQFLVAPLAIHVATRDYIINDTPWDLPDADTTVALLADSFCRAVETGSPP